MKKYRIEANDNHYGVYEAENERNALDVYAKDAGYRNYEEVAKEFGDDATATELDIDHLFYEVSGRLESPVFYDSYGDGVALIDGISYHRYEELAALIGKNIWDFDA